MGYMVVRDVEGTIKVHLSEISVLIIENTASSITTALLSQLVENKINYICPENHSGYESLYIIDKDLCCIDNNELV